MASERENDREELVELLFFSERIWWFAVVGSALCFASGGMGGAMAQAFLLGSECKGAAAAWCQRWGCLSVFCMSHGRDGWGGPCLPLTPWGRSSSPRVSLPAVSGARWQEGERCQARLQIRGDGSPAASEHREKADASYPKHGLPFVNSSFNTTVRRIFLWGQLEARCKQVAKLQLRSISFPLDCDGFLWHAEAIQK